MKNNCSKKQRRQNSKFLFDVMNSVLFFLSAFFLILMIVSYCFSFKQLFICLRFDIVCGAAASLFTSTFLPFLLRFYDNQKEISKKQKFLHNFFFSLNRVSNWLIGDLIFLTDNVVQNQVDDIKIIANNVSQNRLNDLNLKIVLEEMFKNTKRLSYSEAVCLLNSGDCCQEKFDKIILILWEKYRNELSYHLSLIDKNRYSTLVNYIDFKELDSVRFGLSYIIQLMSKNIGEATKNRLTLTVNYRPFLAGLLLLKDKINDIITYSDSDNVIEKEWHIWS